MSKYCN